MLVKSAEIGAYIKARAKLGKILKIFIIIFIIFMATMKCRTYRCRYIDRKWA
jgi:hypothetical protein